MGAVGRVASLPLPPPPAPAAATPGSACPPILRPAIFSTPLSLLQKRAAGKSITACARACSNPASRSSFSIHCASNTSSGNGGALNPVSRFLSGGRRGGGFAVVFASSRRSKRKSASPGFVEMDDGDEDCDEWEDEDGEGEEDGPAMPFDEMRRWLRNKPAGFGEGKSYETAIEDRLLEEMEQSRNTQFVNVNKLKNGVAGQARAKKQHPRTPDVDVAEVAPNVARVRVRGLPHKRNIHRDLKLAFKRFPSIVNISPAVVGNKKTRDPVCKGFAFIDFNSDEAANKFVQTYSKQNVLFGKVQKEIICDIVATLDSYDPGLDKFCQYLMFTQQQLTDFQGEESTEPSLNVSMQDLEEKDSEGNYGRITSEDQASLPIAGTTMGVVSSGESFRNSEESFGLGNGEVAAESGSSKQKQKGQMVSKKKSVKTKPDKVPKLAMPGSVARLKVKERAVLNSILSKYGGRAVPVFSEES